MFTPGGLRRAYVYLDPDAWEAARKLAFDRGISISALIAQALEEHMERQASGSKPPKP
jgi:hypothetical protein